MKSEHLVGTSIPRFTYDTPTVPGNDFYALCEGVRPLCMIFLPGFDHPVTREYITRYLRTLPALKGVRLACVVRSSAQSVAAATRGSEFPFPVICDAPGVLYGYLGVEQTRGLLSWSFEAQKIFKAARNAGYHYDKTAPQLLPLTLVVGHLGQILFTHSGRSQTDLPEDCKAICDIVREVERASLAAHGTTNPHCSDETLTLPDLVGWEEELTQRKAAPRGAALSHSASSVNRPGMPQMAATPTSVNTMRDQMELLPPSSQPTKSNWNSPTSPQLMPPTIIRIRQTL